MSTKTTFKRIALVAVAALGLGVLSVAPSNAVVSDETLTATASSTSVAVGESVTVTVTNTFTSTVGGSLGSIGATSDSRTVVASVSAPAGGAVTPYYLQTSDTVNAFVVGGTLGTVSLTPETAIASTGLGLYNKAVYTVYLQNFTKAGTYYVTLASIDAARNVYKTSTLTITVAADNTTVTQLTTYLSSDALTAANARKTFAAGTDSAIVADAGTAGTASVVGYLFATAKNSAADTTTAAIGKSSNICLSSTATYCEITVTATGGALVSIAGGTAGISATMQLKNNSTLAQNAETLIVYSSGTSGTGSVTLYSGTTALVTKTITFTGAAASASDLQFSDTVVTTSQTGVVLNARIKDSASNLLKSGTVYLYSSDTKVAGSVLSTGTNANNTNTCSYSATYGMHSCAITVTDTGTATFYVRDSWTVAASSWVSSGITLTVTGETIKGLTVSFDKATYSPGERAVITLTATDAAGRAMGNKSITGFSKITPTPTLTTVTGGTALGGTNAVNYDATSFQGYLDSGVETRVVTMPTYGTAVSYEVAFTPTFGTAVTKVIATATVADPTKDAADAATDAALEATDAAYAAQDAAQLAAESADAATAAAEAATAAAEAATAAVEDLATKVAGLFADLQKQITTLANVVAKIAKKVKA